ncbi:MAG: stage II sporulation protein P [Candidatus Merdivicinus sp.]|jgi:stage II sporulation protein P
MRTRLRRKYRLQKILAALFAATGIGAAAAGLLYFTPGIAGYAVRAGLLSAGLTLPEGGLAVLEGHAARSEASDSAEPSQITLENRQPESSQSVPAEENLEESIPEVSELEAIDSSELEISIPEPEVPEENRAALVHKTYTVTPSNLYIPLENGYIKNCTSISREEIEAQIQNPPYFTIENTDQPQVLIMHTHTTESYVPFTGEYYDKTMSFRSTDNSQNMSVVGDRIAAELEAAGIGVIHDTTQHDYPSYNGSYDRSAVTVQKYLEQYPSIKIVLDVHRDAIASGDSVYSAEAEIDGKKAAQVMIISGCDDGTMGYPEYMKNLSFAAALQNQLEGDYPSLTRPILFDYRKYNQQLTTGSILLEVGSHGNTLEQAAYTGELIGKSLGRLLNNLKK